MIFFLLTNFSSYVVVCSYVVCSYVVCSYVVVCVVVTGPITMMIRTVFWIV